MTVSVPVLEQLRVLPKSQRRAALVAMVEANFKAALLMSADDVLPLDANYFDLGLTSLRATEVKQRLEEHLGCEIDTAVLFGNPTVSAVLDHLTGEVLADLFGNGRPAVVADASTAARKPLVDQLLKQLYEA